MTRYRCAIVFLPLLLGSSAVWSQDDWDAVGGVTVTGAGFTQYHAVPVSVFRRLAPARRYRLSRSRFPRGHARPFLVGVSYYFFPRCRGHDPNWNNPSAYNIPAHPITITLHCPR